MTTILSYIKESIFFRRRFWGHASIRGLIRHYPAWRKSFGNKNALDFDHPWINYMAIDFLEEILKPKDRVFEWGAGASTLYFGRRCSLVVSVEPSHDWYWRVNCRVKGLPVFMTYPEKAPVEGAIDSQPDSFFDIIMIDGIRREECLKKALSKVKDGGWIILDNSDRSEYFIGLPDAYRKMERRDFTGPVAGLGYFSKTTFWRKSALRKQ